MEPLKATLEASRDAVTLARLFQHGDSAAAAEMVLGMSKEELRTCLIAQSGFHAVAVMQAARMMGCTPDAIFDGAAPGMRNVLRDQYGYDGD
jgi:hypothetical protein